MTPQENFEALFVQVLNSLNSCSRVSARVVKEVGQTVAEMKVAADELSGRMRRESARANKAEKRVKTLEAQVAQLNRTVYGSSSERMTDGDVSQELLDMEAELKAIIPADAEKKSGKQPMKLPVGVKEITRDFYPDSMTCDGCSGDLTPMKTKKYTRIEYQPARVVVFNDTHHECRCNNINCSLRQIKRKPVDRYLDWRRTIGSTLINEFAIQKHYEHIPVHRNWFKLLVAGHNISRGALNRLVNDQAKKFKGIANAITNHVISGPTIHLDETFIKCVHPKEGKKRGKPSQATFWVMTRNESRFNPHAPLAASFYYSPTRKGEVAEELLSSGSVTAMHCDGHPLYNRFKVKLIVQHCFAHVRRKFERAVDAQGSPFAKNIVRTIRTIYDLERTFVGSDSEERAAKRQRHIRPVLEVIKRDLENAQSADGLLEQAIKYTLSRWDHLCRFIWDGRLEMDNNLVENAIRGLALTRRNSLFIQNEDAGESWAIWYTLIETCKLNRVDPRAYIGWITDQLNLTRGKIDPALLVPWLCPVGKYTL
ncbi:IS66 family transposase [Frigidibacter sp. MR17.24]|uniref:IS66 family transposase n=1 Tax=Frigidibacter sp. MR17.24 TaxID=3127345 RepID=UPI003012CD52